MEEDVEVIFESWLYKYGGFEKQKSVRLSSAWKKKYFVLLRVGTAPVLQYYEKKPRSLRDPPKEKLALHPWFKLERHNGPLKGREYVCEISTEDKHVRVAAEDERLFHLLMFFTQTQRRLHETLEKDCYIVRPDNSEDHRKLGSRGSMCLLHVSKCGMTLSVQLSKCVLAQWPLRAIKSYESTGRGQFLFDAGRRGPTGSGLYVFNTRSGQDNIIYDHIDKYVMELAGLKQMVSARSSQPVQMDTVEEQHLGLLKLTEVVSDSRFMPHLRKISRDIYDHLAQHIGGSTMSRLNLNASNPDLLSDTQHSMPRSVSTQAVNATSVTSGATAPRMIRRPTPDVHVPSYTGAIPKQNIQKQTTPTHSRQGSHLSHDRQGSHPAHDRQDSQQSGTSVDSQYLHMNSGSPEVSRISQTSSTSRTSDMFYMNSPTKTPPAGYDLARAAFTPVKERRSDKYETAETYRGEQRPEDKVGDYKVNEYVTEGGAGEDDRYVIQEDVVAPRPAFVLQRQHSRSAEDLSEYMRMSIHHQQGEPQHSYDNGTFRTSDESALSPEEARSAGPGLYSYASPRHQRAAHSLDGGDPYSAPMVGRPARPRSGSPPPPEAQYVPPMDGFATVPSAPSRRHPAPQRRPQLPKSRSNPNLLDGEAAGPPGAPGGGRSPSQVSLERREDMARVFVKTRRAQYAQAQQTSLGDRRPVTRPGRLELSSPQTGNLSSPPTGNHSYNFSSPGDPQATTPKSGSILKSWSGKSPKGKSKFSPTTPNSGTPTTMKGIHASAKTKVFTKQASGDGQGSPVNGAGLLRRKDSSENPMHGRRLPSLPPQDPTSPTPRFPAQPPISETTC